MALDDYALQAQSLTYSALEDQHTSVPPSSVYWSQHYFDGYMTEALGTASSADFQYRRIAELLSARKNGEPRRIVSIGAGECIEEIAVCKRLVEDGFRNFHFECADIAGGAIERARERAGLTGVADYFRFHVGQYDTVLHGRADVVIAIQCLHHFTELEDLFDRIKDIIGDNGIFVTNDMIGRNGHMLWPEALAIMDKIWGILPSKYKYNHVLGRHESRYSNWDNSKENNEGIRAQDILPELLKRFHFDYFFAGGNLGLALFSRHFGANFDHTDPDDRAFIDMVGGMDNDLINIGYLKPCLMIASMSNSGTETRCYKHWTPQFCVRTESPFAHLTSDPRFEIGEPFAFSERTPGAECLREGWSSPEESGVWSNAPVSRVEIPLREAIPSGRYTIDIVGMQYMPKGEPLGAVSVSIQGTAARSVTFGGHHTGQLTSTRIEADIDATDRISIEFRYDWCIAPAMLGLGAEMRRLAFRLAFIQIARAD